MVNLLIGNNNIQEVDILCHELANDKDYRVENVATGKDTIIFILSEFSNFEYLNFLISSGAFSTAPSYNVSVSSNITLISNALIEPIVKYVLRSFFP